MPSTYSFRGTGFIGGSFWQALRNKRSSLWPVSKLELYQDSLRFRAGKSVISRPYDHLYKMQITESGFIRFEFRNPSLVFQFQTTKAKKLFDALHTYNMRIDLAPKYIASAANKASWPYLLFCALVASPAVLIAENAWIGPLRHPVGAAVQLYTYVLVWFLSILFGNERPENR